MDPASSRSGRWTWYVGVALAWLVTSWLASFLFLAFWNGVLPRFVNRNQLVDLVLFLSTLSVVLVGGLLAWAALMMGAPSRTWVAFAVGSVFLAWGAVDSVFQLATMSPVGLDESIVRASRSTNVSGAIIYCTIAIAVPLIAFLAARRRDSRSATGHRTMVSSGRAQA